MREGPVAQRHDRGKLNSTRYTNLHVRQRSSCASARRRPIYQLPARSVPFFPRSQSPVRSAATTQAFQQRKSGYLSSSRTSSRVVPAQTPTTRQSQQALSQAHRYLSAPVLSPAARCSAESLLPRRRNRRRRGDVKVVLVRRRRRLKMGRGGEGDKVYLDDPQLRTENPHGRFATVVARQTVLTRVRRLGLEGGVPVTCRSGIHWEGPASHGGLRMRMYLDVSVCAWRSTVRSSI